ncbi:MAG: metallophosphoesterase [Candidatus Aminicenantes bacterium]|nr:metallophosphoesterase [Candidatus Aminicenantes bacterium]
MKNLVKKNIAVKLFVVIVFLLNLVVISLAGYSPRKLIRLDASILPEGPLRRWKNLGLLGGEFVPVFKVIPSVKTIKGQKACDLTAMDVLLRSTFSPPAYLNGKNPFTVLARVFLPELAQHRTILTWSTKPNQAAIIGIGKARDAAFSNLGTLRLGYADGYPEPQLWHLVAVVYDKKKLRVYVDGWLKGEKEASLEIKPDRYFYLGGQQLKNFPLPFDPLHGYLAFLEVIDTAMTAQEVWQAAGHREAIPVFPPDNQKIEELSVTLKWEKGDERAASYQVYFSSNREEVIQAEKKALKASLPLASSYYEVEGLKPGQVYFWRVDQLDAQKKLLQPGLVMSFKVDRGAAKNPVPHNLHGSVNREIKRVRWTPGKWAISQDVFFSADPKKLEKSKPVVKDLRPDMNFFFLPDKEASYGRKFFWRVDSRTARGETIKGETWSFRIQDNPADQDLTFFVAADLHYGGSMKAREVNQLMVREMNSLPGQFYPEEFGLKGKIHTPRGVIILGDIVDDGEAPDVLTTWQEYVEDFGLKGEGLLAFPVYEGFGENDGSSKGLVRNNLQKRNKLRPSIRSLSADGLHYSWDWGKVHFVHLNLYPGRAGEELLNYWRRRISSDARYPKYSLDFLIEDLRRNVGGTDRPVVIFQHYGFDSWSETFWTERERNAFLKAIEPYNVVAIFWGHSHVSQAFSWHGIKTWCAGTLNNDPDPGEFLVVNIKTGRRNGEMIVAERTAGKWVRCEKFTFPMKKTQKKK